MLKIKSDMNKQGLKRIDLHLSNPNNFRTLEVVDRVSETQPSDSGHLNLIKANIVIVHPLFYGDVIAI